MKTNGGSSGAGRGIDELPLARVAKLVAIGAFFLPWVTIEGCGSFTGQQIADSGNGLLYAVPVLLAIGFVASLGMRSALARMLAVHDAEIGAAIVLVTFVRAVERLAKTGVELTRAASMLLAPLIDKPGSVYGAWVFLIALVVTRWLSGRAAREIAALDGELKPDPWSRLPRLLGALSILVGLGIAAVHVLVLVGLLDASKQLAARGTDWPNVPGAESARVFCETALAVGQNAMLVSTVVAGLLIGVGGALWSRRRWARSALLALAIGLGIFCLADHRFSEQIQSAIAVAEKDAVRQVFVDAFQWLHWPAFVDALARAYLPRVNQALFSTTNADLAKMFDFGERCYFLLIGAWPLVLFCAFGGGDARRFFANVAPIPPQATTATRAQSLP